jgi:hypothetical protein
LSALPLRNRLAVAGGIGLMAILGGSLYFLLRDTDEAEPAPLSARVIDELRGTYRGVGIGDSGAEVRRVFGPRSHAGDGPLTPLGAGSFAKVGGAMVIRYPGIPSTPRTPERLRYQEVSFLLMDDRVFALMITDMGAATQQGVAIGSDLDAADERYEGLNCEEAEIGDFGESFPFCAGVLAPERHIWFGQDPIRSMTITTTSFGGAECPREQRLEQLRRAPAPPVRCW